MTERMPDRVIPGRLKQVLARMTKGFAHGTLLRERAMRAQTTAEMFAWIEGFFAAVDAGSLDAWVADARRAGGFDQAAAALAMQPGLSQPPSGRAPQALGTSLLSDLAEPL
jgi:hypothetical protein